MKIIFVVHTFDISDLGGVLKVISMLANALSERGWSVSILSLGKVHTLAYPLVNAVQLIELDLQYYDTRQLAGVNKIRWFTNAYCPIQKFLNKHTHDSIFITSSPPLNILFSLFKQSHRVIGCDHTATTYRISYGQKLIDYLKRRLDVMIGLTPEDAHYYKQAGIRSEFIPNFIEPSSECVSNDKKYIIWIGRLSNEKRPILAIQLYLESQLNKAGIKLRIYGYGPLENEVKSYLVHHDLEDYVEIIQGVSDPLQMFKHSICLLSTSSIEGFGMVFLEAMGLGIPCISFDAGYGPKNIIRNGINGYLIQMDDNQLFCEKMRLLCLSKTIFDADTVRSSIEPFYKSNVIEKWEKLFHVISEPKYIK